MEGNKEKAAKYYNTAAEQGDVIGLHWMGVYYMEAHGVSKNLEKSESMLIKAHKAGNAQSAYQLFLLYSTMEPKKDAVKAYQYLTKAVLLGVTYFEKMTAFFKEHFTVLAPVFLALKGYTDVVEQKAIENLHAAYLNELSETFMAKLGKDRLYERACGFVTDQQIWLIGVLMKYFLKQVMHFDHEDFLVAMSVDLGPLLGDTGLWALKNYEQRMNEKGAKAKRAKAKVATDLINEFMENGLEKLGKTSMYNMKNKYSPKKLPDQQVRRSEVLFLYSWTHYAPLKWFEHIRRIEDSVNDSQKTGGAAKLFALCDYCQSPESNTIKHKRCSQCKQRLYCSNDCQKFDWKQGHGKQCKTMAAKGKF